MAIANRGFRRVWQGHRPFPGGRFAALCCAGSARFGHAGYQTGKREERMAQISGAAGTIRGCPTGLSFKSKNYLYSNERILLNLHLSGVGPDNTGWAKFFRTEGAWQNRRTEDGASSLSMFRLSWMQ